MKRVNFTCVKCGTKANSKHTVVDHIDPVIDPKVGFPVLPDGSDDWVTYISRLFCGIENLQILCIPCHNLKSGKETKARVKYRKKRNAQT